MMIIEAVNIVLSLIVRQENGMYGKIGHPGATTLLLMYLSIEHL